jgi:hypothetical protein
MMRAESFFILELEETQTIDLALQLICFVWIVLVLKTKRKFHSVFIGKSFYGLDFEVNQMSWFQDLKPKNGIVVIK